MLSQKIKGIPSKLAELPPIPEKLYFTIGEVSLLCDLRPHVLRYWEQEFNQLSPVKRRGNRRYYQLKDVLLVRKIRHLLYEAGFTIEGARQQLTTELKAARDQKNHQTVFQVITDLEKIATDLEKLS